jgi:hypothetical protein
MRLAPESHDSLEAFFRAHCGDAGLVLPRIEWQVDTASHLVASAFRISAITLGRRVLVRPGAVRRDAAGRWWIGSRLAAHEAMHVLQYQRQGWAGFLYDYLGDYAARMQQAAQWNAAAHFHAYEDIRAEREAQAAEDAYARWRGRGEEELR